MLLFLDTEFTAFIDIDLISIGIVSEDGLHEFYAERSDYRRDWASDFVKDAVVPHLGQRPERVCSREDLTRRLYAWLCALPSRVQIACDSDLDRDLLWDALEDGLPSNLDPSVRWLAWDSEERVFHDAVFKYHAQPNRPRHHALHDALAMRLGWLALNPTTSP
jgi:hypothetical protein